MPVYEHRDQPAFCVRALDWGTRLCGEDATHHPAPGIHLCDEHQAEWDRGEDAKARLREQWA